MSATSADVRYPEQFPGALDGADTKHTLAGLENESQPEQSPRDSRALVSAASPASPRFFASGLAVSESRTERFNPDKRLKRSCNCATENDYTSTSCRPCRDAGARFLTGHDAKASEDRGILVRFAEGFRWKRSAADVETFAGGNTRERTKKKH